MPRKAEPKRGKQGGKAKSCPVLPNHAYLQDKAAVADRCRVIRKYPYLRDRAAGPPDEHWTWEKLTDPATGEKVEGWSPDDTLLALGPAVVYSMTPEEELAFPDALVDALNHRDDPPLTVPERSAAANAALRAAGLYNGPDGFHDKTAELAAWRSLPTAEEELRWTVENDTYPPRVAAADEALRKRETPEQTTLRKLEEWRKKDEERRAAEAEAQALKLPKADAKPVKVAVITGAFKVSACTLRRAVGEGKLRDCRPAEKQGTNCPMLLDPVEVARYWPRRVRV